DALCKTCTGRMSPAKLTFNKDVHRPFDEVGKIMREQEGKLARVLDRINKAEPVLRRYCGIERELIPICQRVTRFDSEGAVASPSREVLDLILQANSESRRQPHLYLLPEQVHRCAVPKEVAFISSLQFKAKRRKHIRLG